MFFFLTDLKMRRKNKVRLNDKVRYKPQTAFYRTSSDHRICVSSDAKKSMKLQWTEVLHLLIRSLICSFVHSFVPSFKQTYRRMGRQTNKGKDGRIYRRMGRQTNRGKDGRTEGQTDPWVDDVPVVCLMRGRGFHRLVIPSGTTKEKEARG